MALISNGRYCARALDLGSAMTIACSQARLVKDLPLVTKCGMLSIDLSEAEIYPYIRRVSASYAKQKISLSSVNGKRNVVISGALGQLNTLKEILDRDRVSCEYFPGFVGYHSAQMSDIAPSYMHTMGSLSMQPNKAENAPFMVSTVKSRWIAPEVLRDTKYWAENLAYPVQFLNVMAKVCSPAASNKIVERGYPPLPEVSHVLEIGPHSSLHRYVADILRETGKAETVTYSSMLMRNVSSIKTTLDVAGLLYCSGFPVDLGVVNGDESENASPKLLCDPPQYPFNHGTSYWRESRTSRNYRCREAARFPLLGTRDPHDNEMEPRWRNTIRQAEIPWVEEHKASRLWETPRAILIYTVRSTPRPSTQPLRCW